MHMNLLFAIDDNVSTQLMTCLYSIVSNTPNETFDAYVIQKEKLAATDQIESFCKKVGVNYHPIIVDPKIFKDAPITDRYPETIYYRLLAHEYLPKDVHQILYLDVDILVLNSLKHLYEKDLGDKLYAAASHSDLTANMTEQFNKLRLGNYEAESYFNSGVLLMNIDAIRQKVKATDIFNYISANKLSLFLPDQDVLNALYGDQIVKIPDEIYNYDARMSAIYYAIGNGQWDLDWVIDNTVILHFCGRDKPWRKDYTTRYSGLYKHYAHKVSLLMN
ncbi:MAG: glycosyltransferase family 8 protein [Companilactobacillus sp.]|nr:glycosyltransferase family 8 protein [Companilactobacillus sp.]MCH4009996.1 glycosyltransferase family 8 protein [Companilactobacillus sp.]MCH4052328.1 glycosyltransferase family 8 protein [Companilactobacillus sp.]MCH4077938.1 glycosyltransferase family 8 protein [Companilactobacillus sp.]MCH4126514.1 glycosyltransferase family 8 protein [Companilactobacillus sp.]MCH4132100.1 glycosyltransferase family 8 protein [Companilactobacillus sp.]